MIIHCRNFFGLDWMQNHPNGLKTDFDAYFKGLSDEHMKVSFLGIFHMSMMHADVLALQLGLEEHGSASKSQHCECTNIV